MKLLLCLCLEPGDELPESGVDVPLPDGSVQHFDREHAAAHLAPERFQPSAPAAAAAAPAPSAATEGGSP